MGCPLWTSLCYFLHFWLSLGRTNESNLPGRRRIDLSPSPFSPLTVAGSTALCLCFYCHAYSETLHPQGYRFPWILMIPVPSPFLYRVGHFLQLLLVRDNQSFSLLHLLNTPLSGSFIIKSFSVQYFGCVAAQNLI